MPSIQGQDIVTLVNDLKAGKVDWLLILNSNPVYTAPVDLHFEEALGKAKMTVHLGSHFNETAVVTEWHINGTHYLENWSDTRAYDGTATVIQPMIDPLYGGKSAHDVIQSMLSDPDTSPYEAVRKTWQANLGTGDAEHAWRKVLHDGMVPATAYQPKTVSAKISDLAVTAANGQDGTIEVIFRADPNIYDGRYTNVGWLQEDTEAGHQHFLGQCSADELPYAGEIRAGGIGRGRHRIEWQYGDGPGHGGSRPPRWVGYALLGLRAPQRGPSRRWTGLQCLRGTQLQRSALCFRRDHEENRADL